MLGGLRIAARVIVPLLIWELLSRLGPWPRSVLPGPGDVARSASALLADGRLVHAAARSLVRLAQGYAVSVAVGVPLGVLLARQPGVNAALRPAVLGLQALPSVCWLPIALLWFGPSELAVLLVVVMGSLLAVAISTEDAVAGVDPLLLRAAGTLGVRGLRFVTGVLLPAALPGVVTGLKLGWSFAWRALMAGELLYAGGGIGRLLQAGREANDAAQLFAVMLAIVAIGVAVDRLLFRPVEVRVRRRWGLVEAT
jgi:NitT/TauT family transport system permease protein